MAAEDEVKVIGAATISAFGEVANAIAFALSEAVGQQVSVGGPELKTVDAGALAGEILAGACGVTLDMSAASAGVGMLVFDGPVGRSLAGLLAGDSEPDPAAELDEARSAKLTEIGTSIGGVLAGTLGVMLGKGDLAFTAGEPITELQALAGDVAEGEVVHVSFPVTVGDGVSGAMHLVSTSELPDQLERAMGGMEQVQAEEQDSPSGLSAAEVASMAAAAEHNDLEPSALPPASGGGAEHVAGSGIGVDPKAVEPVSFTPFAAPMGSSAPSAPGLDLILDVALEVSVELGHTRMLIKDILDLSAGSIIELETVAGEAVDVVVNGKLVAKGEVVVIEDNFGVRITEIVAPIDKATSK